MNDARAYIGVDPDTETTGLALIMPNGKIRVELARAKGRLVADRLEPMARAMSTLMELLVSEAQSAAYRDKLWPITTVIEWQHIRYRERNPNSMMGVQGIAGAALGIAATLCVDSILTPIPVDWKGSIPKEAHQRRLLQRLGLTIDSDIFSHIPRSMREHCIDALGLAVWARARDLNPKVKK